MTWEQRCRKAFAGVAVLLALKDRPDPILHLVTDTMFDRRAQSGNHVRTGVIPALVLCCGTLLVLLGFFLGRTGESGSPSSGAREEKPASVAESLPPNVLRGQELSKVYCVTCHIYPEPEILDRFTWAMETLPRMAFWVGHTDYDLGDEPDFEALSDSGMLPTAPLMPVEDWRAICDFYLHAAPAKAEEIERTKTEVALTQFAPRLLPANGPALSPLARILPGKSQILLADEAKQAVEVVDLEGRVLSSISVGGLAVNAEPVDGGWEICLIGSLPPSDVANGRLVFARESGGAATLLMDKLRRPAQSMTADVDGNRKPDRLLNEYGNIMGGLTRVRARANGGFEKDRLIEQPGVARVALGDFNGDGMQDIVAALAQARESLTILLNEGDGSFAPVSVADYHPAWGNVFVDVVDFNEDGRPDLLTCNGDSGDFTEYPSVKRVYHGVRILINQGNGTDGTPTFDEAFFFPMYGAYRAAAVDFDEDGDFDIAACSFYPDYATRREESFVYLENRGGMNFHATTCAESLAGRWIAMDAADADGDGDVDLVLGSYVNGPGRVPELLSQAWDERGAKALYLENKLR